MSKNLVIMFVKEPRAGFVKTRLANVLGDERTVELYQYFIEDLIQTLSSLDYDFKLCVSGSLEAVNKRFGDYGTFLQVEGDLGAKMKSAFESQFKKGYEKIILIGSDTPHISKEIFDLTMGKLSTNEIVIGPSLDGGYYLIAFNHTTFNKEVFNKISWSTSAVLEQTLQKLHTKEVYLTMNLNDIDTYDDLKHFFNEYSQNDFKNSKTVSFLKEKLSWKSMM